MKGIIFNHLEMLAKIKLGEDVWEEELNPTKEPFDPNTSYPDADLVEIVEKIAKNTKEPVEEIWKDFGHLSISSLIKKYPDVVGKYTSFKDLLENIHEMHFSSVMKLFSNPVLPYLSLEARSTEEIFVVRYKSIRNLCYYLEGALIGAAAHFKQSITTSQTSCTHKGSNVCEVELSLK